MSERSVFTLAALASAAMPKLAVSGTRESGQFLDSGDELGIDTAVVTDTTGREYDVSVSDTSAGKKRLLARAEASAALLRAKEPAGLGFALERTVAFQTGEHAKGPTGGTAVLITVHNDGFTTPLNELTESQCVSVGTAIGAIHRLRPAFMEKEGYPTFTAEQIHRQLVAWITRLKEAGHVPTEITSSWEQIVNTEGLWSFRTCPVHGGFKDGDMLFSSTGLNAIYHWDAMQVNDPARDLAWIFDALDSKRRNSVMSAYARIIGSRLDDLILLRASLWLQMEQVGDCIQALDRADNAKIIEFKAQVEKLAHQLSVRASKQPVTTDGKGHHPSTITVGNLLEKDKQHAGHRKQSDAGTVASPQPVDDLTQAAPAFTPSKTSERHIRDGHTVDVGASSHTDSKTIAVEQPPAGVNNADDLPTVAMPVMTPADFARMDDEYESEYQSEDTHQGTDDADSDDEQDSGVIHTYRHPTGYVSLIDDPDVHTDAKAVIADAEDNSEPDAAANGTDTASADTSSTGDSADKDADSEETSTDTNRS